MIDLWKSEERGRSLAVYTAVPLLGPAVGAIVGGFVVQNMSWRWMFWGCSALTTCSLAVGLVFLTETFAPVILRRERATLLVSELDDPRETLLKALKKLITVDLRRPFHLLGTQPIIQVLALYMAYLYGLNYLTISTYQALWQDEYGQSVSIGSLNYISIGLGLVLGCQVAGPLNDKVSGITRQVISFHLLLPPQLHRSSPPNFAPSHLTNDLSELLGLTMLVPLQDLSSLQVAQQQRRRPRIPDLHDDPRLRPRACRSPLLRLVRPCASALDHAKPRHGHLLLWPHRRLPVYPGLPPGLLSRVRCLGHRGPHRPPRHHGLRLPHVRTAAVSPLWLWLGEHTAGGHRGRDWGAGSHWAEACGAEIEG